MRASATQGSPAHADRTGGTPGGALARRRIILPVVAFIVFGAAFAVLLVEVMHGGGLVQWDTAVDRWMYVHETPAGDHLWAAITLLGLPGTWIAGVIVAIVLVRRREWILLAGWIAATGGGGIVESIIEARVDRARPPYAATFLHGHSPSFPSGHAFASCTCYIMLVFIVHRLAGTSRARTVALLGLALIVVALVSFSRLYLAVHYPTDVIGGVLAGAAWLALCVVGVELAESRRSHHA